MFTKAKGKLTSLLKQRVNQHFYIEATSKIPDYDPKLVLILRFSSSYNKLPIYSLYHTKEVLIEIKSNSVVALVNQH